MTRSVVIRCVECRASRGPVVQRVPSHCPIVPLSHCPVVRLSGCPVVPWSNCPAPPPLVLWPPMVCNRLRANSIVGRVSYQMPNRFDPVGDNSRSTIRQLKLLVVILVISNIALGA